MEYSIKSAPIRTVIGETKIEANISGGSISTTIGEGARMNVSQATVNVESGKAEIEKAVNQGKTVISDHTTEKIGEFDSNAVDKTQDFNDNAADKTQDFNDNASDKTQDFNDNYVDKKALIDAEVSTAQNAAAEAKQWAIGDPTEPTGNSAKYWADVASQSAPVWGNITGTLSNQTDLQTALDTKANDSDVVKLTGNQTIAGTKSFSGNVTSTASAFKRTSSIDPTTTTGETEVAYMQVVDKNGASVAQFNASRSTTTITNRQRAINTNLTGYNWYDARVNLSDAGQGSITATCGNTITNLCLDQATSSQTTNVLACQGWVNNPSTSTNVVHRSGNETIADNKSFTSKIIRKATNLTAGTPPASSAEAIGLHIVDNASASLGLLSYIYQSSGGGYLYLRAYNPANTTQYTNLKIGYDSGGNVYTEAPTPATSDNSTKIATTAFVKAQGYATTGQLPTVNDATIEITQGGVSKGTFTLNQSSGATIALDAGSGTTMSYDAVTETLTWS